MMTMPPLKTRYLVLLLFLLALLPRLPQLDRFLTTDEGPFITGYISSVIVAFLEGDFVGTYWHFYPGVTMSWLTALGLAAQYTLELLRGSTALSFSAYVQQDILTLLTAARLPYVLLSAAAVPTLYLLSRRLFAPGVALLGALLFASDPFFIAHSRVVHGDAPVTVFMTLSLLAFLRHVDHPAAGRRWLWLSAVCGGLAALTKAPGQFMALFISGLTLLYALTRWRAEQPLRRASQTILLWGLISLLTFIVLWPAMWIAPLSTLNRMLNETFGKVNEGHLVYFFGQPTLDPGPLFYPYVIPLRLTPITLIGALLSLGGLLFRWKSSSPALRMVWLYVISLLLFGMLSPKKQDRYLLPLFPLLDLLAAVGWSGLLGLLLQQRRVTLLQPPLFIMLIILHALPLLRHYPYYLTYFNPLLGGPPRAVQTTLVGWGEGLEQAAAYLNQQPDAATRYVAVTPAQSFLPYFVGTGENFYTNDIAFRADYVLLYIAQRQRLAPSPEIVRHFLAQTPEHVVTIVGLPYVNIYATTPRILPDIPSTAIPQNIGLGEQMRLAGYTVDGPRLTLYWHALAPLARDYTISVRALAPDGTRLTQRDSWPLDGLLPTTLWRQGDYIADTHHLALSHPTAVQQFEVIVYHAPTGETLGPPLLLPAP